MWDVQELKFIQGSEVAPRKERIALSEGSKQEEVVRLQLPGPSQVRWDLPLRFEAPVHSHSKS